MVFVGSLPSGHDEAYPWIEYKDNTKINNIFFIREKGGLIDKNLIIAQIEIQISFEVWGRVVFDLLFFT